MHPEARGFVAHALSGRSFGPAVEVGGRWINGGIRDLIHCTTYTSLDLHPGPNVDVVADVCDWTPPAPVDLVVCCEVLEHAENAKGVVAACVGMLNPGGLVVLTCAGPGRAPHSALDGAQVRDGEHYANITPEEMHEWLTGLDDVEVWHHLDRGDLYATATVPA